MTLLKVESVEEVLGASFLVLQKAEPCNGQETVVDRFKAFLHSGKLTDLESIILKDTSLRLKIDVSARRRDDLSSNHLILSLSPRMEIFAKKLSPYPFPRDREYGDVPYDDFIRECQGNGVQQTVRSYVQQNVLRNRLREAKAKSQSSPRTTDKGNLHAFSSVTPPSDRQRMLAKIKSGVKESNEASQMVTAVSTLPSVTNGGGVIGVKSKANNVEEDWDSSDDERTTSRIERKEEENIEHHKSPSNNSCEDSDDVEDVDNTETVKTPFSKDPKVMVNVERMPRKDERLTGPSHQSKLWCHMPAHSKPIRPYSKIDDLRFPTPMTSFLTSHNVTSTTSIQSMMWPALSRLHSVVALAPGGMGKTLGWLLPVVHSVSQKETYKQVAPGHSPLCIVLCSGVKSATSIHDKIESISKGSYLNISALMSCCGAPDPSVTDIINGVDILVTTPPRLLRLLTEDNLISLNRCCHLVIEDGDVLMTEWHSQIEDILINWKKSKKKHDLPDQMIIVAENWSPIIESFTQTMRSPLRPILVSSNLLEGVICGKLEVIPSFLSSIKDKRLKLNKIIESSVKTKVVICCNSDSTAKELKTLLSELGLKSFLISKQIDVSELEDCLEAWDQAARLPLIVSDEMLANIAFSSGSGSGTILIHWDVPRKAKAHFSLRFAFVKHCFRNVFTGQQPQQATVHMFLTQEDQHSFNTLLPFLERCKATIPEPLYSIKQTQHSCKVERNLELGNPLCLDLATFGSCLNKDNGNGRCQARHFLSQDLDSPKSTLPSIIKFNILNIESPVHYWVRLQDDECQLSHQKLVLRLAKHFSSVEARDPLQTLEVDKLVAAAGEDGVYKRARLMDRIVERKDEMEKLVGMTVFMVDAGVDEDINLDDIAELPDQFGLEHYPAAASRVIISGVVPGDKDRDWGSQVLMHLLPKLNIGSNSEREVVCRGRVLLHLSDLILLDKCQVMELSPLLSRFVLKVETSSYLVKDFKGQVDLKPLQTMVKLARDAGIEVPRDNDDHSVDIDGVTLEVRSKYRQAFLLEEETLLVYMSECYSPDNFFLTLANNYKSIQDLEADMRVAARNQNPFYNAKEGDYVIVCCEAMCRRGQVTNIKTINVTSEEDNRRGELQILNSYSIFLLDTGITDQCSVTDIFKCNEEFLTRIPFQAIQCRLGHVSPVDGKWSVAAGDKLFDLTRDDQDEAMIVECNVLTKDEATDVYSVQLRCGVNIAEDLCRHGMALLDANRSLDQINSSFASSSVASRNVESDEFDVPNGLEEDLIDMDKLKEVTGDGLDKYLEQNIPTKRPSPCKQEPQIEGITSLSSGQLCQPSLPLESLSNVCLAPVGLNNNIQTKLPLLTWSQSMEKLFIKVNFMVKKDIDPSQVFINIETDTMKIDVVELFATDRESEVIQHSTPTLLFTNKVEPSLSIVSVKGASIDLVLGKAEKEVWDKLVAGKFSWIKINPDALLSDEDHEQNVEVIGEESKDRALQSGCTKVSCEILSDESDKDSDDESFGGNNPEDMKDLLLT